MRAADMEDLVERINNVYAYLAGFDGPELNSEKSQVRKLLTDVIGGLAMNREPCYCGADDCPRCHPENDHEHEHDWRPSGRAKDGTHFVKCRICGEEDEQ